MPRLIKNQRANIAKFLRLFVDLEKALKKRLGRRINDSTGVRAMINEYAKKNPYWADSADLLRNLADIRNILTHQCGELFDSPIVVAPTALKVIRDIKEQLLKPETVLAQYRRVVKAVSADDSIAFVLVTAYENGFSQFPVVDLGRFSGLITENEIVRWLGRSVNAHSVEVNLAAISVRMVLKEKDPFLKGISIFHFEKLDAPVKEVMGCFSAEPALEVILLTESGNKHAPIEGIITQWDAARYSG